jgi:hypothetical protein
LPKECVFCGNKNELQIDHLIPKSRGGSDSADNILWSCRNCNVSRGDKGIFQWLGLKKKDNLHRLVAGKYLKQLFDIHKEKATLDIDIKNIAKLCPTCRNTTVCIEWSTEQKLTCFCLESLF